MDKKNQNTSFLMVVGIIFIVISGTVFVSRTWSYLPIYAKQIILLLASLGLFAGSYGVEKREGMEKTETALYYLAASFLGLFILSLFGGIMETEGVKGGLSPLYGLNETAVATAGFVMLFPVLIRFVRGRRAFDFTLTALLADWIVFWFMMSNDYGVLGFCVMSAVTLTVYTVADFLRDRWTGGNTKVEQIFWVLYIVHIFNFVVCNISLTDINDVTKLRASMFAMSVFMVCITAMQQIIRRHKVFTVLNSLSVFWSIITGIRLVNEIFSNGNIRLWNNETETFIIFSICAVCMAVLARTEMIITVSVFGVFVPFMQICSYGGYVLLFSYMEHIPSAYIPFSGVLAVSLAFVILRKYRAGELDVKKAIRYGMAVFAQVIVMFVMLYASKAPFFEKGIYGMLMLQSLSASFVIENKTLKIIFRTFALLFGEILALVCADDLIPKDYMIESGCLIFMAGVLSLGIIWKNSGNSVRSFQFLCVSVLMIVMLHSAFVYGDLVNALILGITGAVMLFVAAVRGNRHYVILSSVILIFLVFYLTRNIWALFEWWVYLFVAGVALVLLAVKKEKSSKR